MEREEIDEVLTVFEGYREKFPYAKDAFALSRILDETGEGKAISEIKKGPNGRFLGLPLVREFIAKAGNGKLTPDLFFYQSPEPTDLYMVTLDKWGSEKKYWGRGWEQMARPGYNLVVQLNLSGKHLEAMRRVDRRMIDDVTPRYVCHPVRDDGTITAAWARVDMDVDMGVALIEELQSDWVRNTASLRSEIADLTDMQDLVNEGMGLPCRRWLRYLGSDEFRRIEKNWAEALLEATVQFLRREVGISDIYLYDFETGCRFKGMDEIDFRQPRSIYTRLPKRFGMARVEEMPSFLLKRKRDRQMRKVMDRGPTIFWKLGRDRSTSKPADEPPGFSAFWQSMTGSGYAPLSALMARSEICIETRKYH